MIVEQQKKDKISKFYNFPDWKLSLYLDPIPLRKSYFKEGFTSIVICRQEAKLRFSEKATKIWKNL